MLFSVVIPLFNKARYIQETLSAVLNQSFQDFEVIVVDDGSQDQGPALVESMGDARIRVVRQANAGVSAARNRGIDEANAPWIAFLDADDLWAPDYLGIQAESVRAFPDAAMAGTAYFAADDLGDWVSALATHRAQPGLVERIDDVPARWLKSPAFFTSSVVVRADLLKPMQPCFPPGESLGEDLDLWFRLGEKSYLVLSDTCFVGYRLHSAGSLMAAKRIDVLPAYLHRMRARAVSGTLPARLVASSLKFVDEQQIDMARECAGRGERWAAMRWLAGIFSTGIRRKRWWVSWGMLAIPAHWATQWQRWRVGRTAATLPPSGH